jgi:hypothetical protein
MADDCRSIANSNSKRNLIVPLDSSFHGYEATPLHRINNVIVVGDKATNCLYVIRSSRHFFAVRGDRKGG